MNTAKKVYTFIDLFAGIGGMRLAFEQAGCRCVFSSEWNDYARKTYAANFGDWPEGDINEIDAADIPSHDILVAGFPCQPFSISGVSKKKSLGRPHGFDDPVQGNLFFRILEILDAKRPAAFLLENVKNLRSHDRGRTFRIIGESLVDLGYQVQYRIIDASDYVPQHRERIYIVGFREPRDFFFPIFSPPRKPVLADILERNVPVKYTLTDRLWRYLQNYARKHRRAGNGFGYGLVDGSCRSRTLSARYYKDGSEILIAQPGRNPRRLTPRECARLMGFPDDFIIPVSDTQAYRQFGNSVVVPLVRELAEAIVESLRSGCSVPKRRKPHFHFVRGDFLYEGGMSSADIAESYQLTLFG